MAKFNDTQSDLQGRQEANTERQLIFTHEEFSIRMMHAVSGGGIVALLLAQKPPYMPLFAYILGVTLLSLGLFSASLASYYRYYFKLNDIKRKLVDRDRNLKTYRFYMSGSLICSGLGLLSLLVGIWVQYVVSLI